MDAKSICVQQLLHLSTAVIMGRQAPHKAVLLLAIMDMIEAGEITTPRIVLTDQLEKAFEIEWNRFIGSPLVFKCRVATPYWHMQNEPFYSLYLNSGVGIHGYSYPYSVKRLREDTYAVIDQDLFSLMQDEDSRNDFRNLLINKYLVGLHSDLS